MKKILIRIVGSLCIIASTYTLFMTNWVQIDGIRRKDMREIKTQITTELDTIGGFLDTAINRNENLKDELRDYDLPYTSGQLKRCFRETEKFLLETVDEDISFKEVFVATTKLPQYIKDTESVLDSDLMSYVIFENSNYFYAEDMENVIDEVAEYTYILYIVAGVFVFIALLGLASAVMHMMDKRRFVKYFYIAIVLVLVCGICIALPIGLNYVKDGIDLPEMMEDVELKATFMPYVTLLLAIAPMVLDIIFEKKKQEV